MQEFISGKPQLNRRINSSIVLELIQQHGSLSRADLAKLTGIKPTSISAIVEQLIKQQLLREVGRGKSTGGRHPILLEINPGGLYAAGIEIGEDNLNGVMLDLSGRVLASESFLLPDSSVPTIAERGNELLDSLCASAGIARNQLASVGIAVPGNIDKNRSLVVYSKPLGWKMVDLAQKLNGWHSNIHILNNAMAGAMTEYFDNRSNKTNSLFYVLIHLQHLKHYTLTSLGCAIVLDGRAYFGEGQTAGEIKVDIHHPLAIAQRMNLEIPGTISELIRLSLNNPEKYRPVWDEFSQQISRVISSGVDLLSPGRVVIGVDTPDIDKLTEKTIREQVNNSTVIGMLNAIDGVEPSITEKVVFSQLRQDTLARGAIIPQLLELCLSPLRT